MIKKYLFSTRYWSVSLGAEVDFVASVDGNSSVFAVIKFESNSATMSGLRCAGILHTC